MIKYVQRHKTRLLLGCIIALSFFFSFYGAWNAGYSNAYYTAAVKSMLSSWHSFFFASFDPGGFLTVDKPAFGLWIQCLFGFLFGVTGWSLILAESISAACSVFLLYDLVSKRFGKLAGLIAALCLTVTPIFVAVARTNNLDSSLILLMLLSSRFAMYAAEKGSLKHLVLAMIILGLGFNVKSLQAVFVLPAIACVYFFTAPIVWGKRVLHLVIGAMCFVLVAFSWVAAVDLTPKNERPFVSGSQSNSEMELLLGYNGVQRIFADADINGSGKDTKVPQFMIDEGGEAGVLRLWNKELGTQISWLSPLAAFGILFLLAGIRKKNQERMNCLRGLIFWGLWILPMIAYLSIGEYFHLYYLAMLAPGFAALSGIACVKLWGWYAGKGRNGYFLIGAIVAVTVMQLVLLSRYPDWYEIASWIIIIACIAVCALLILLRVKQTERQAIRKMLGIFAMILVLAIPTVCSCTPLLYTVDPILPVGGPALEKNSGMGAYQLRGKEKMIEFLEQNYEGETYLVAVSNAMIAAPLMLQTGKGVLATGGFTGADPALTVEKLQNLVVEGKLRFIIPDHSMGQDIVNWVQKNGTEVFKQAGSKRDIVYDIGQN
ncbi:MAG: glycosyltransferase family 39 protein [Clostridia bacterium]